MAAVKDKNKDQEDKPAVVKNNSKGQEIKNGKNNGNQFGGTIDFEFLKQDREEKYVKETKAIYAKQCPGLNDDMQQKDLWKTLAVGRKNNIPLLPLIIDSFSRDRLDYYFQKRESLQLHKWVKHITLSYVLFNT